MLNELLDRLANGGLEVHLVSMKDLDAVLGKDSPTMQASRLTDWFIRNGEVVRRMHALLESHGQPERAERLMAWWTELCRPLHELAVEIPASRDDSSKEEDLKMVERIKETAEPLVECGRTVLRGIIDRQIEAMVLIDFDDLIT